MADKKKKKKGIFSTMFRTPGTMAADQSGKKKSESLKKFQKSFKGSGVKKSLMGS